MSGVGVARRKAGLNFLRKLCGGSTVWNEPLEGGSHEVRCQGVRRF